MNWKKLFSKTILDRGYEYYCDGAVEDFYFSDNIISAAVAGSEDYEVEIVLSENKIEDMYCSCPYAEDGHYCKHMSAVLYAWDKSGDNNNAKQDIADILFKPAYTVNSRNAKHTAVEKLVAQADDNIVCSFLTDILTDNEKLCIKFYNIVNKQHKTIDVQNYFRQVDLITRQCAGRDDFINYHDAYDYIMELEEIIDNDVRQMIDNGNYMSAFEIVNHIFVIVSTVDIDDSDGEVGMLGNCIYDLWIEILKKAAPDDKRKMFDWFIAHTDGSIADYAEEFFEHIVTEAFNEKEFEQDKLEFFRSMIDKSEQLEHDWSREYAVGKWALRYLNMLAQINSSDELIEKEMKKYCKNSDVRKLYINICMQKKEYDKAIRLLDDGLKADKDSRGLVSEYSNKKKKIYLITGDKDAYIKQLWSLVLEHNVGNMDLYRELKAQYTEDDWCKLREKIFRELPQHIEIAKYYNEEKLYDRLLECVLKSYGLYMLDKYEKVLKKEYPEQLLGKYKIELDKMAGITGNRKHYADMVVIMRRMKKITGGTKLVGQIAAEWREKYRNRPAMMDELSKL